jgi:Macrocin-O-methyltransferase (TylF)
LAFSSSLRLKIRAKRPWTIGMKKLEEIWAEELYQQEPSYTDHLGLMLQPDSYSHFDTHPEFAEVFRLWTQKDNFRGMDKARIWSLILNIKQVLSRQPGALAELGVYQGQCAAVLSYFAEKFGRAMYLADTFTGFPEGQYELGEGEDPVFVDTSLEDARKVVGNYAGNRWIVGVFPDSITQEMRNDRYAFVSIDCDLYAPIADGLKFFWPRMVAGGMIFVHDYSSGHWAGATQAVDEFCEANGVSGILLPDFSGSYVLSKNCSNQGASSREAVKRGSWKDWLRRRAKA